MCRQAAENMNFPLSLEPNKRPLNIALNETSTDHVSVERLKVFLYFIDLSSLSKAYGVQDIKGLS